MTLIKNPEGGTTESLSESVVANPNDSLQSYFDDLLLGTGLDELETVLVTPVAALAKSPPLAVSALEAVKKTQAVPESRFADPMAQQKQSLQKLLHSVQPKIELAAIEKLEISAPSPPVPKVAEIQEWDIATTTAPAILTDVEVANVDHKYHVPGVEWLANGLPSWAQTRFDVLLVKVSGLTLAVPLISLGQIQPITDELTHIFGQADWFIGIQPTLTGKIRIVNTAKFVMPERYDENFVKTAKLLVSINGVPWGLAVDSVNQPISLAPEAIKWRTDRSKRPWLAGIIKDEMCALLDIPMIGQMLMESDKNLAKNFP